MVSKVPTTTARTAGVAAVLSIVALLLNAVTPGSGRSQRRLTDDITPEAVIFNEDFESVTPPALPAGWASAQTGSGTGFQTVAVNTTTTRTAFTSNPATAGLSEIVSPAIAIGTQPARLTFRHRYATETSAGFDGGVLEISIGAGAYQDILAAGGSFLAGAYTQTILAGATGNPLIGRMAWTGVSSDFVTTIATLPAAAANQSVRFRWRFGTDQVQGGQGWWIDDVRVAEVVQTTGIVNVFNNTQAITIPQFGAATPYPSAISVSNIPTQLAKVTVTLRAMSHTFPSDVDIMLVGPQGQTAVIMSDVGGGTDMNAATLTLDDAAATPIPNAGIVSGTYRPTNNGAVVDSFPAPAPPASVNASLTVFEGTNPNGNWRLFVVDNVGVDAGSIAMGWTLTLTSAISGQNTGAIEIPASGTASPYPSEIAITDHNSPVSRVVVNLVNFSHSSPDDVDILLTSPSGRSVVLMSDVGGGNAVTNLNLTFDDSAPNSLPDDTQIVAGAYRPTDFEPGDVFPAPAPAATGRTLSSLNGTSGNGAWKLFVVDDSGNNVGNISGGWNVLVGTAANQIIIDGNAVASPYPGEVTVSGLAGSITRVTVTLTNFSHLAPDDLDILLVGPSGRKIVLMSDAGGQTEAGGINLTFDDQAPAALPDDGPLATGSYRPADYEPGEVFPAPAPSGPPTGSTLNAFYGSLPNGIWRLYVVGDTAGRFGSIAGNWSVTLQTSTSACLFSLSPTIQPFPVTGGSGSFTVTQPVGCSWTASTADPFMTITSGNSGSGNGTVAFTVAANEGPARTGLIEVTNGVITRAFQVQQASGCPLSVNQTSLSFAAAGGPGSIVVTAGSACSWQGSTTSGWIQVTSAPQQGNGTLNFNVLPNTSSLVRSGVIEIGSMSVTVNQAADRAARFDFDGDSRTDLSIFRPSAAQWWILDSLSGNTRATQFGLASDRLAVADYDGDERADIAVYRDGTWYVLRSSDGTVLINNWGVASDIPVPANYTGGGAAEIAVFRPSAGQWWILNSDGTYVLTHFGLSGDVPTPGDYDGDGRADISIYRPAAAAGESGTWWITRSQNGAVTSHPFGITGDIPVAADYDGDGRDNVAVFRPSTGVWYRSLNAATNYDAVQWGSASDVPVPGDYDGDGRADPAVVRFGSDAVWYVLRSSSGPQAVQFGLPGDRPVPAVVVP